jgi:hypothetical protein
MSYAIVTDGVATPATPDEVKAHVEGQLDGQHPFKTIERWSRAYREDLGVYEVQASSPLPMQRKTGGLTFADGVVSEAVEDMPLGVAKARLKEQAAQRSRTERIAGTTLTVSGSSVPLATDWEAESSVQGVITYLGASGVLEAVTRSGHVLRWTPALAVAALSAIHYHHAAVHAREAEIVKAIDAASDLDELTAIDINSGWPS